ncbi:hypothetical protein GIW57_23000 [Stenotrophomonas sp. PA-6-5C]|nr:hypothetical protein [Stenotrophomonas sp. PA-6-5C]
MSDVPASLPSRFDAEAAVPPVVAGDHLFRWLVDGRGAYAAMLERIASARGELALEFYICKPGQVAARFRRALIDACRRGVRVRLMLDAFGSDQMAHGYWRGFEAAGGQLRWFNPLGLLRLSFRNHRKLLLADGVAIVGGLNIADEYDGDGIHNGWRDLALEVDGPLVEALYASFERHWTLAPFAPGALRAFARSRPVAGAAAGQPAVLLSGPGCRSAELRRVMHRDLGAATRVDAHAAYFLPSGRIRRLLAAVARRGSVRVLVPASGDVPLAQLATRHAIRRMAGSGVGFFEYVPQMLHSKLIVIDDIVYIGSANLDARSRLINFEVMLRLPVPALAMQARALIGRDLDHARPSASPATHGWTRLRERMAYLLLSRVDPYLARRKLRMLQ